RTDPTVPSQRQEGGDGRRNDQDAAPHREPEQAPYALSTDPLRKGPRQHGSSDPVLATRHVPTRTVLIMLASPAPGVRPTRPTMRAWVRAPAFSQRYRRTAQGAKKWSRSTRQPDLRRARFVLVRRRLRVTRQRYCELGDVSCCPRLRISCLSAAQRSIGGLP